MTSIDVLILFHLDNCSDKLALIIQQIVLTLVN